MSMDPWVLDRIAPEPNTGCWLWTGQVMANGYGKGYRPGGGRSRLAHRIVYERLVGPIPEDREIDHLCRTRSCVNPAHLEPVTRSVNLGRSPLTGRAFQTHCRHGHALTAANTYVYPRASRSGRLGVHRGCRTCIFERQAIRRAEAKGRL